MSERTPDYIGTWNLVIPAQGLFEVYLDKKNGGMTGRIEDTLGTAIFTGVISKKTATFMKKYKPGESS